MKWLERLKKHQEIVFLFFISCFTVSVTPSINTPESSNDVMIFIAFICSFKINKVNLFPALTAPFSLIFLSNLLIAFEVKLLTNPGNSSLAKGIAMFVSLTLVANGHALDFDIGSERPRIYKRM